MASLSSGLNLGGGSVSSLLRSANSIQKQITAYNDSLAAYQYELSAKTDGDLATYQDYLSGRITTLRASNNVTDAEKALTLTKTLTTAIHSNTSANIQRENIQMMSGNSSLQGKYNVIVNQYQRAISIGDLALAQQLESQAYSVSQSIQYQAQQSALSAQSLAKASASLQASGQQHVATNLMLSLKQLNNDVKNAGLKDFNSTVNKWVKANNPALQALGVHLPSGVQPNYFDIVHGVAGAIYNAHMLAYQAELPYNPDTAQGYYNQAIELASGITNLPTLAGSRSVQEIQNLANNPSSYAYDQTTGRFVPTKQSGYEYQNGNLTPTYTGHVAQTIFLTPQQTTTLTKLNLEFTANKDKTTGNGVKVQATPNSPDWLKQVLGDNGVANIYSQNGVLTFEADSLEGAGKELYAIGTDSRGFSGLFAVSPGGVQHIGGEAGFNVRQISELIGAAFTATTLKIAQDQQAQALKLAQSVPKLPSLKVTPPSPQPALKVTQAIPNTRSVTAPTFNPQKTAPASQVQGSAPNLTPTFNPQGSNASLLSGPYSGGGLKVVNQ